MKSSSAPTYLSPNDTQSQQETEIHAFLSAAKTDKIQTIDVTDALSDKAQSQLKAALIKASEGQIDQVYLGKKDVPARLHQCFEFVPSRSLNKRVAWRVG